MVLQVFEVTGHARDVFYFGRSSQNGVFGQFFWFLWINDIAVCPIQNLLISW
jgi:hypothetical protein